MGNVLFAFGLTLFAGLSTGIGSLIAFFARAANKKFLSLSLGFSAGVMIYISLVEIFSEAKASLVEQLGLIPGNWATVGAFFGGMLLVLLIDKFIPEAENPHELQNVEQEIETGNTNGLMRTGIVTALVIAVHNFPEGMATFVTALQAPTIAVPIAFAIAIHNIPEGIAVSVPVYYATGNRKKAFAYSFLSGLAEPLGALVGYLILMPFLNPVLLGIIFAAVAGVMVFISLDELLPAAIAYSEPHLAIYGLVAGMAIMAVSLLLFL